MTYYIMLPDDSEKDAEFSSNVLGEESFGTFYPEQGFVALFHLVNESPELVESIKIKDEKNKNYSLTEFFDILSKLSVQKI